MIDPLFTFVHVTDTHLSESLDVVIPLVASINAEQFHPRPSFVVFGGDNINGHRDDGTVCEREMPMLKERLEKLQVPYYAICHNHDTWGEDCQGTQFRKYFGETVDHVIELPGDFSALTVSGCTMDDNTFCRGLVDKAPWLDDTLKKLGDQKVLLFSHLPMFPSRKPVPEPQRALLRNERWEAFCYGHQPEQSRPVRDVIAKHGNIIAHYTGHCHVHSVTKSAGTHYITTGALATQPWEYRYVVVYPDRMEHTCVRPHTLNHGKGFWINCIDEDHPDVELYHNGLPEEREFTLKPPTARTQNEHEHQ